MANFAAGYFISRVTLPGDVPWSTAGAQWYYRVGPLTLRLTSSASMRCPMAALTTTVATASSAAAELSPNVPGTRHRTHSEPPRAISPCMGFPAGNFWNAQP